MIVTAAPLVSLSLPPTEGRTPGVHMSDLYNSLYQDIEPKRYDKSRPMDPLRIIAGLALERAFERTLIHELGPLLGGERPGEFETEDGLPFTPDLIIVEPQVGFRLGEIKCTWMSARDCPISPAQADQWELDKKFVSWDGKDPDVTFPPKFDKYFTQMKVYCYHIGIVHARLFIFFVNGCYAPPKPILLSWDFEFTPRELHEEWIMVKNDGEFKGLI